MTRAATAFWSKAAGGIERKAKDQRTGDVHDAKIPCLHREGRQKWDAHSGPLINRHAVQRCDVEKGIDGREGGHDQVTAPGKNAAVMLDRFVIDPFGYDWGRRAGAVLICHGSSLSRFSRGVAKHAAPFRGDM